ncbi:MAG: aldo/keto reductase [Lachnospiraceae bacterium]|nr:aldo/keto reductase [Lachnospiraceae bacterium]
MKKRQLRNITVSEIGMGCMGFSHGYGDIPEESYSIDAIRKAIEYGCTFFDTAEAYGPNMLPENRGHNERLLGKAISGIRKDIVIATKMHLSTEEAGNKGVYQTIKDHLIVSMKNLQTDYVDLYYLHRVNRDVPMEEVAGAMGRFIDEGLIRGWGLSQVGVDTIKAVQEVAPLSAVQNIYSMVERSSEEEVIPYCEEHSIGVVPFSPTASGFLSGKVTDKTDFSHSDDVRKFVPQLSAGNIDGNQAVLNLVNEYAKAKNASMAQVSLAWMLHKYPNVVPIPGSKNQERILENLGACAVSLTKGEFDRLDKLLNDIPVKGFRGHVEFQGDTMKEWGRKR